LTPFVTRQIPSTDKTEETRADGPLHPSGFLDGRDYVQLWKRENEDEYNDRKESWTAYLGQDEGSDGASQTEESLRSQAPKDAMAKLEAVSPDFTSRLSQLPGRQQERPK
jgi:hypothetical protein